MKLVGENLRLLPKAFFAVSLVIVATEARAATFPVKNARAAIAIAKEVCWRDRTYLTYIGKEFPNLKWEAVRVKDKWIVSTIAGQSVDQLAVDIPINGPYPAPRACYDYMYFIPPVGTPSQPK